MKGSLQIKGNKYYVVVWCKDEFGKPYQKWINTEIIAKNNKTKATAKMKEILKNMEIEQSFPKTEEDKQQDILFVNFIEKWIPLKKENISPTTYWNYQRYFKKIKAYFKDMRLKLKDLKPFHIEGFYKSMYDKGLTSNSVLHYHVLIRQALKYAVINDFISSNVADKIERPKKGNFKATFYSKEDIEKLFDCLKDNECKIPIMLTAMYGFRRSETIGLKWKAIDFENNTITVEHKVVETKIDDKRVIYKSDTLKNKTSNRKLPLIPQAKELLLKAKQDIEENKLKLGKVYDYRNQDYVCVDNIGRLILPNRLTKNFEKVLKRNNLKHIRFHDLRHSCASLMLSNGVTMKQIQEWLGHADFGTTANIYAHLDYSSKLNSAHTISNVFNFANSEVKEDKVQEIEISDDELDLELERLIKEKEEREERKSRCREREAEM